MRLCVCLRELLSRPAKCIASVPNANSRRTTAVKPLTHAYKHRYIIRCAGRNANVCEQQETRMSRHAHIHSSIQRTQVPTSAKFICAFAVCVCKHCLCDTPSSIAVCTSAASRTLLSFALLWRGALKFTAWRPQLRAQI